MDCTNKLMAAAALAISVVCAADAAMPPKSANVRPGDYPLGNISAPANGTFRLAGNHTLAADTVWNLYGIILVGNGAVLTIEPGTIIRGMNERDTGVVNRPGMLIVERGGKIYANGTPELPIIFTDQWDNHFPWLGQWGSTVNNRQWDYRDATGGINNNLPVNSTVHNSYDYGKIGDHHGAWGGVVLCGKAFVNWDGMSRLGQTSILVEGVDEGLGVGGGGNDDDDSSGEFSYVQVRYGGYSLISSKEINGMTFYGVGRGTKMHHVEVYNNIDDSFEWFGGCNNAKYLIAWGVGDDVFDSDAGFRGKNQFLFGVQRNMGGSSVESGASDKGMEMDGYEKAPDSGAYLFSASLWANITLLGMDYTTCNYYSSGYVTQQGRNVALSIRDNASPRIYNSIFMDFGSVAGLIENRTDYTMKNGVSLNSAARFTSATAAGNFPSVPNSENLIMADGQYADASYLYSDGAMADIRQARISNNLFWNISGGMYPTEVSNGASDNTNPYRARFPWTSNGGGSGPWVTSGTAYGGWVSDRNVNQCANNDASGNIPIKLRLRTQVAKQGTTSYDIAHIDPRPSTVATNNAFAVPDIWMTPVQFSGAFEPTKNWAKGWTVIGTLQSTNAAGQTIYGVFGAATQSAALTVEGDVFVGGMRSFELDHPAGGVTIVTETITVTNGVNGIIYQDDGAFNGSSASDIAATAIKTSPVVTYSITAAGVYQLQATDSLAPINWQPVKTFTVTGETLPVAVNLTDLFGNTPENAGDQRFYRLQKQ